MLSILAIAALAVVFIVAAMGQTRSPGDFERFVYPIVGRHAPRLRRLTIALEVGLATVLVASAVYTALRPVAGWAAFSFIVVATGVYAMLLARGTAARCQCFGAGRTEPRSVDDVFLPMLVGLRNGALGAISLYASGLSSPAVVLILVLAIAVLVALGLGGSILRDHRLLAAAEHPLARDYAPQLAYMQAHAWWVNGHARDY